MHTARDEACEHAIGHGAGMDAAACLRSLVGPSNAGKWVVASQDADLRDKMLAAQAAGKAAFWADPAKKAARIAKRAATIERRRAERLAQI